MGDMRNCKGCRDDYYNGTGAKQCWMLPKAAMVKRWRIGTWTQPTQPGAFTEVRTYSCYHQEGQHFSKDLPSCAKDPIRR